MGWATLEASANRVAFNRLGGVSVTAGAASGMGILNRNAELVSDGQVISAEYHLTVETALFGSLQYGDGIIVDGESYMVRQAPMTIGDGANCFLLLEKPAPGTIPVPERPITETRIDTSTTGVIYVGQAINGAAESSPVWTITRSTYSPAGIRTGKGTATGVTWTGRSGHTYT